jgi:hypothetical protein
MQPQNEHNITERIWTLEQRGIITPGIAHQLRLRNGHGTNGALHFLFFPPADHKGDIFSTMRHWGGDDLFRFYGKTTKVAHVLRSIGVPVIIEASVPISRLLRQDLLQHAVVCRYLHEAGVAEISAPELMDHEDHVTCHLEATRISRIIRAGQRDFYGLSGMRTRNNSHGSPVNHRFRLLGTHRHAASA